MRRLLAIAVVASLGLPVPAAEGVDLSLRSRSLAAASTASAAKNVDAPFRTGRDPLPEMILTEELERRGPRGSCETATTDLCYDLRDGRVVYRKARAYMPRIDGLTAESISVRRDRVIFKYSF
jgi:hypothetical protein